tara:strand:+ start:125 stop:397 length:273 start_codon:yes stop_codon:yes gene_type:complete
MLLPYFHKVKISHYYVPQSLSFKPPEEEKDFNFIEWIKSFKPPEECETIWDCEDGLYCCDFIITKVCCPGGMMIPILDYIPIKRNEIVFN